MSGSVRTAAVAALLCLSVAACSAGGTTATRAHSRRPAASPTATASSTPTVAPTATVAVTATPKPTAAPTATPKPTAEPTATPKPTAAPTAVPKPKPTPTPIRGQYLLYKSGRTLSTGVFEDDLSVVKSDGTGAKILVTGPEVGHYSPPRYNIAGAWSADGSTVHTMKWVTVGSDICTAQLSNVSVDTGAATPISVTLTNRDVDFVWSSNDAQIAFDRWRYEQCAMDAPSDWDHHDIMIMNADGTGLRTLAVDSRVVVTGWLPNGSALIGRNKDTNNLVRVNVTTGASSPLVPHTTTQDANVAHDGSKIAYIKADRLHVANANGTGDVDMGTAGATESHPLWAPSCTQLVLHTLSQFNGVPIQETGLFTPPTTPGTEVAVNATALSWSPDSQWLAAHDDKALRVIVINIATNNSTVISAIGQYDTFYGWQP